MKRIATLLTTAAAVMVLGSAVQAQMNPCNPCSKHGTVFHVDDPMDRNVVTFKSSAPLEDIVGTTNNITGHLVFDPEHPEKGGSGELTVKVGSFNTGIPLRDQHLQGGDWLNAEEHPGITMKIREVRDVRKLKATADFQTYDVTVVGDLQLYGKSRRVEFPGRITYLRETEQTRSKMEGNLLAARGAFTVSLSDFGITGPPGMDLIGTKVGEEIEVEVSIMGTTAAPEMAGNVSNPCAGKSGRQVKSAMNPCNPCGGKNAMNPCNPCGGK